MLWSLRRATAPRHQLRHLDDIDVSSARLIDSPAIERCQPEHAHVVKGVTRVRAVGIVPVGFDRVGQADAAHLAARRFVGGKPLVEWILRRASDAQQLSQIVAVLPADRPGHRLQHLIPPDVLVRFVDRCQGLLAGACNLLEELGGEAAVALRLQAPLADPELIDRLVATAQSDESCDYATFCSSHGDSAVAARLGLVAEWCRLSALKSANAVVDSDDERNCLTRFICRHADLFKLRLIPLPEPLDQPDLRLGIHSEEDWEHAHAIADALGEDRLDWQRIARLIASQPALRRRMRELNAKERGPEQRLE